MSNMMKIAAIVLALLGLLLGLAALRLMRAPVPQPPVQQAAVQPAAPASALQPVVLAAQDIPAGQTLTAGMLKVAQWPRQPAGGFAGTGPVLGKVARLSMAAGDPVLRSMLAGGLATHLDEGQRAVGIPLDDADGAAARIAPGDMVDVFFTLNKDGEVGDTQARLLLSRVRVLSYGAESVDGPGTPASPQAAGSRREAAQPRSATLAVPLDDVNRLLLATRRGKLRLVLRNPQDDRMPDLALFPKPEPVLKGRGDLTSEQRAMLGRDENLAYAGASLPQLAGSPQDDALHPTSAQPRRGARRDARTVEVIRGDKSEKVAY